MSDFELNVNKNLDKALAKLEMLSAEEKKQIINYEALTAILRDLKDMTGARCELENLQPGTLMSEDDLSHFETMYKSAENQCAFYLNSKNAKKNDMLPVTQLVQSVLTDLARDQNVITARIQGKKPASLAMIMNESRIPVIDIGDNDLGTVGGTLSSRIPFSYTMPDGKVISGVFTKKNYFESKEILDEELDHLNKLNKNDSAYKEFFDALYPVYLRRYEESDNEKGRYNFADLYCTMVNKNTSCSEALKDFVDELYQEGIPENVQALFNRKDFPAAAENFHKICKNCRNRIGLNIGDARINDNSRIDSRNSAMTAVADMLGMPNVIARSVPMKIRYKGEVIEGTFMEKGLGMHITKPTEASMKYTNATFDGTAGLKSVSDLMILDFICGNTDRHRGNMMYQFDTTDQNPENHRFTGVQGIDNDSSFGLVEGNEENPVKHMAALNDMKAVAESTARAVMKLDPEVLTCTLREMEITEDQIKAAKKRLSMLKTKVREALQSFEGNTEDAIAEITGTEKKVNIRKSGMTVIGDADFKHLTLEQLIPTSKEHLDAEAKGRPLNQYKILTIVGKRAQANRANAGKEALHTENVNFTHGYSIGSDELNEVKAGIDLMKRVTFGNYTSPQFEELKKGLEDYRDFCALHENEVLTEHEYQVRNRYLQKIKTLAEAYKEHKKADKNPSGYARKRMRAVDDILSLYSSKLAQSDKKLYAAYHDANNKAAQSAKTVQHEYEQQAIERFNAKMRAEAEKISRNAENNKKDNKLSLKNITFENLNNNLKALNKFRSDHKTDLNSLENELTQYRNADNKGAEKLSNDAGKYENLQNMLRKNTAAFLKARVYSPKSENSYDTNLNMKISGERTELEKLTESLDEQTRSQFINLFDKMKEIMHKLYSEENVKFIQPVLKQKDNTGNIKKDPTAGLG